MHACMYACMYICMVVCVLCVYVCVCVCVYVLPVDTGRLPCLCSPGPLAAASESLAQPTGHSKLLAAQECRDKDRARSLLIRGRKTDLKRSVTDSAFRKAKSAETYRQTRLRV
jgi:hypothetical protein